MRALLPTAIIGSLKCEVRAMALRVICFGLALLFSAMGAGLCHADCAKLNALAQRHANDMARRNSLDHAGFMRHRGPAGAVAENVAVGCLCALSAAAQALVADTIRVSSSCSATRNWENSECAKQFQLIAVCIERYTGCSMHYGRNAVQRTGAFFLLTWHAKVRSSF